MFFRPLFRKPEAEILEEAERAFGEKPPPDEIVRHLDRELTQKFTRQFDLIKEASQEITRRIEAGELDRSAAETAKSQMALQVAQSFKTQKAEALKAYEEGLRHEKERTTDSAMGAFKQALSLSPIPPFHLAIADTCARSDPPPDTAGRAEEHYRNALDAYRNSPEKRGFGIALCRAGLYHRQRGNHEQALTMFREALAIFGDLHDREKTAQIKALIRVTGR